jgi:UMF1 family MFS transporter
VYFSATALTKEGGNVIPFLGFEIKNTVLFSYSVSFAFLFVVLLVPFTTAVADYTGRKKVFMRFFCYLGALSCASLYFFTRDTVTLSVFAFMLSIVGYSGSIVFYNSFLPEIATEENYDRYSARGFSLGYIGSVLLMLMNLVLILAPERFGITDKSLPARIAFLTVGIWWFGFAQIPFYFLPSNTFGKKPTGNWVLNGYKSLLKVLRQVRQQPLLANYLLAYFIYNMGVMTVMYVATIFGANELKLASDSLIITILLIQLVGIVGSYLFAYLSSLWGNIYALMLAVGVWVFICLGAYFTTQASEFYLLAVTVGMVMGGIQALSRATYTKLIPDDTEDTASYFSFYDVTEKLSIVIGTAMYGLIEQLTGSMRNSILALLVLFVVGFILLSRIPSQKVYHYRLASSSE